MISVLICVWEDARVFLSHTSNYLRGLFFSNGLGHLGELFSFPWYSLMYIGDIQVITLLFVSLLLICLVSLISRAAAKEARCVEEKKHFFLPPIHQHATIYHTIL